MRDDLDPRIVTLLQRYRGDSEISGGRVVARMPTVRPQFYEKGRYIPPSISRLIVLVSSHMDLAPEAICGNGRHHRLVNARFCVAKLAEEFAPRLSDRAVDDAMLRGEGMTRWYRSRHADRANLFPEYQALYDYCRAGLLAGVLP